MPESNQKLRSEAVQDILTKVPHWMIMWGNTIMLLMVVIVFILASIIKYPDVIEVKVKITSSIPSQKESSDIKREGDDLMTARRQLIAQLSIPISKGNQVKADQAVHVKLFSYPQEDYGVLRGEIPSTYSINPDQEGLFKIDVPLGRQLITSQGVEILFDDDMYGNGDILTEEISLLDRIFYRFKDVFD